MTPPTDDNLSGASLLSSSPPLSLSEKLLHSLLGAVGLAGGGGGGTAHLWPGVGEAAWPPLPP